MRDLRSPLDRPQLLKKFDPSGMAKLLVDFSHQVEEAIRVGESFQVPASLGGGIEKIVFVGMGGSAIAGDVIRSLVALETPLFIGVSRHYRLPPFVDSKTLCIFSSYSGNTEETLSAFREGMGRGLKSVVLTSGGELGRQSEGSSTAWIKIPRGLPPRSALGYLVFPVLRLLGNLKLHRWDSAAIREVLSLLKRLGEREYAPEIPLRENRAKQLARDLWKRFVVIYAGTELLEAAALRFRTQIEENAKAIASHHLLPEMNHNEILGWRFPKEVVARCASVFLEDLGDHPRIRLRMKITKDLFAKEKISFAEVRSQGKHPLARLFSVIYLGDWVSFYLALLYGMDPTPVKTIDFLKKELAKVPFKQ